MLCEKDKRRELLYLDLFLLVYLKSILKCVHLKKKKKKQKHRETQSEFHGLEVLLKPTKSI